MKIEIIRYHPKDKSHSLQKPNFKNIIKYKYFPYAIFITIIMACCTISFLTQREQMGSHTNETKETLSSTDQSIYDGAYQNENSQGDHLEPANDSFIPTFGNIRELTSMEDIQKYLYNIDKTAYVTETDLDIDSFLKKDFKTVLKGRDPKILIFHTHSQETFIDSRVGEEDDSIVGVGKKLSEILVNDYNIPVVHDVGQYDVKDGKEDRTESYQNMEPAVKKLLEKYPTVEIIIDLHRDGVPDDIHFVTEIDGRKTAKIMLFNGITKINKDGKPEEIPSLLNPYLNDNLALSLQMHLTANEMYPDFTRRIYIKPYRYSLHLLPKSMLVEIGANTNTVEEAKNAMYPFAKIIAEVFEKEE